MPVDKSSRWRGAPRDLLGTAPPSVALYLRTANRYVLYYVAGAMSGGRSMRLRLSFSPSFSGSGGSSFGRFRSISLMGFWPSRLGDPHRLSP